MSSEPIIPASLPPLRPGMTTCTTDGCRRAGSMVIPLHCPDCGNRVHQVQKWEPIATASPIGSPRSVPAAVGAGEMLSRTLFGGFWALVTAGLILAAITGVAAGHLQALVALLVAVPTGLYARYIFRGGRFRILFW